MPPAPLHALVIVPPMLKVVSGPLLGPSILRGAAQAAGHTVEVLDLNNEWLASVLPAAGQGTPFVGDHDKPEQALAAACDDLSREISLLGIDAAAFLQCRCTQEEMSRDADILSRSRFGTWIEGVFAGHSRPGLLGLSILHAGQVGWAHVAAAVCRRVWPGVPVIAGGSHVTALADVIAADVAFGEYFDGFVAGYAEETFVQLVGAVRHARPWPPEVFGAGSRGSRRATSNDSVLPSYYGTHRGMWLRRTLPAQASRGCSYGACTFCTYPVIEGASRRISEDVVVHSITKAAEAGAAVSFKDSLLTRDILIRLAELIRGRVEWSGVTKLSHSMSRRDFQTLRDSGCRTLEFGLETLDPRAQRLIHKSQPMALFEEVLARLDGLGISVVINYMTGLPNCNPADEARWREVVCTTLGDPGRSIVWKVEHHRFELERLAALAHSRYVSVSGDFPWASVLDFIPAERDRLADAV